MKTTYLKKKCEMWKKKVARKINFIILFFSPNLISTIWFFSRLATTSPDENSWAMLHLWGICCTCIEIFSLVELKPWMCAIVMICITLNESSRAFVTYNRSDADTKVYSTFNAVLSTEFHFLFMTILPRESYSHKVKHIIWYVYQYIYI